MSRIYDVAVLVGSLRRESLNRKMANALAALAPAVLRLSIVEIGPLPLYNPDLEAALPPEWAAFRARIKAADAVLFVTPEYNRGLPGVLKNALDVASRPYGQNAFDGKPGAVVSVSPGAIGGFGANHQLRQSLAYLNVRTMGQPEAYVGGAGDLFGADGSVAKEATRTFLEGFMQAFVAWVATNGGA